MSALADAGFVMGVQLQILDNVIGRNRTFDLEDGGVAGHDISSWCLRRTSVELGNLIFSKLGHTLRLSME
jgi:hypothetical protein